MKDLVEILKHIEDLYCVEDVDKKKIEQWLVKYPERAKIWQEGLAKYEDYDIIQAIDEYWRYKDNKVKPKIVHIQALLNTKDVELVKEDDKEDREKLAMQAEITKQRLAEETARRWERRESVGSIGNITKQLLERK